MPQPMLAKWHLRLLGEVYSLATKGDAQRDPPADRACVLEVFSLVRPGTVEVAVAQALERLHDRDLSNARALLEKADTVHPRNAMIKALLTWCLFMQRDGLWQFYATEVDGLPLDATAVTLTDAIWAIGGGRPGGPKERKDDSKPDLAWRPTTGLAC